ncbi:MAG: DEAD/DEAH box helicase family protein [Spirochaetia bacterium]|jgi:type III restriction enzyme|nr:DEAD/DEAH box helicase family protein [Spirochaetia bacterium]
MLNNIILQKRNEWLHSADCSVKELMAYIKNRGYLRDTQIEAIETYLFLKIQGENKPLWQLFSEGFFAGNLDLSALNINQEARDYLQNNTAAHALFDFSRQKIGKTSLLPNLEKMIIENPTQFDYIETIRNIFYGVNYSDYLMSLPMGAGKTYLMAAFIYLDLYFALNEPGNPHFAHNFLILIPSGLKTSIGPSLRTIEKFDPSWVIPEPSASELKKQLHFDVLDEQKSAKKSNKARNPNAQKVNQCLPNPFGQVFVVNAEKVILDRVEVSDQFKLIERTDDEKDQYANELRDLISKIPNLTLLVDEVHHATSGDIKLRQVINKWNEKGNITTVLGFSGTPYLSSAEIISLSVGEVLKSSEITNTVYYYPLTTAIEKFLKKPELKIADNLTHLQIVKQGIEDFDTKYGNLIYNGGTIAKLAIYCSNIEMLEEEIYPYLQSDLNINPNEILRFHGGNNQYTLPKENGLEFNSLDTSISRKKYILLVGIGKEGWDCKSLTAVILPQKSKSSSKNTIIQTTCRCLRQVAKGNDETALVWLNRENASILNSQLEKEQHTSIEEINNLSKKGGTDNVERFSRMDFLKLPKITYYQLKIKYQSVEEEKNANTREKLDKILQNINQYKSVAVVTTTGLENFEAGQIELLEKAGTNFANYNTWIFSIAKESLETTTERDLHQFDEEFKEIFKVITFIKNNQTLFDEQYDLYTLASQIRVCFSIKKYLKTDEEIIPKEANLLIVDKLKPVENHKDIYPDKETVEQILSFDKNPLSTEDFNRQKQDRILQLTQEGRFEEIAKVAGEKIYPLIEQKDRTFHLLPYNFGSGFESKFLETVLKLKKFKDGNLEIYFNGERGITEFVINCFAKKGKYWQNIGKYTTDFLMIQRSSEQTIYKALIIETKGEVYANDKSFIKKKNFVETAFLSQNEEKFGYQKFDFLYLEDSNNLLDNMAVLNNKIDSFFKD